MYNYGILDGNFFLRRNYSAAKGSGNLLDSGADGLARSFLSTVLRYKEQFELQHTILVWDKSPYKKLTDINEYKQNRHYVTQESIDELTEQITKETDQNKRDELILQREKAIHDLACEKVFAQAKDDILTNLEGSRLLNVRIAGYEADDLAYLISKHLAKQNNKCILISADSDWITFVHQNVDVFREAYSKKYGPGKLHQLKDSPYALEADDLNCSVYEIGNLREAYTGGHNNVSQYKHSEVPFMEFARKLLAQDATLPEYEYFWKRVAALNINNYENDIVYETFDKLNNNPISDQKARDYLRHLGNSLLIKYLGNQQEVVGGFLLG